MQILPDDMRDELVLSVFAENRKQGANLCNNVIELAGGDRVLKGYIGRLLCCHRRFEASIPRGESACQAHAPRPHDRIGRVVENAEPIVWMARGRRQRCAGKRPNAMRPSTIGDLGVADVRQKLRPNLWRVPLAKEALGGVADEVVGGAQASDELIVGFGGEVELFRYTLTPALSQ